MFHLLDINVLIALSDPGSDFHAAALRWTEGLKQPALATCPLTENGFLRVYGHPQYPGGPGSISVALTPLRVIRRRPNHVFLADDYSLADAKQVLDLSGCSPKQLTDMYLLGLAARHGGKFATFDAHAPVKWLRDGAKALEVISPK
ncbi:MAG: TA system VapC family ribonuclease toxin [Thermoflexales bacterium]